MSTPTGLCRCDRCGELAGTLLDTHAAIEVVCLCTGIVCGHCKTAAIRRPISDHYDEATGAVVHTPWFGFLMPCATCRRRSERGMPRTRCG